MRFSVTVDPVHRSVLWRSLQAIARILVTVLFDLKIWGAEHIPRRGGALLAATHQSYLDPVLVAVKLRRPVSYMAKSSLFVDGFFGWLIRALHAFPVRQGEADIGAMKECVHRLTDGHLLNIYPEGSRSEDGEIGKIEKGIALIIRRAAGSPVIPVVIDGSFDAFPRQRGMLRAYPIRVLYGKPMMLSDRKGEEIIATLNKTYREMLTELRTRRRAEQSGDPMQGYTSWLKPL